MSEKTRVPLELVREIAKRHVSSIGTMPVVGSYDEVASPFND